MTRPFLLALPLVALLLTASRTARAEREIGLGLSYDARAPVGSLRRLVSSAALRGVQGRWEYYAHDTLTAGVDIQYVYLQQGGETETVAIENGAATAAFRRYVSFLSFVPTVRWLPWGNRLVVRPFFEIGAGLTTATGAILASDLSQRAMISGLIVQPSAGVLWPIVARRAVSAVGPMDGFRSRSRETVLGITASLAYSYTTTRILDARDLSFAGAQIGIYSKL